MVMNQEKTKVKTSDAVAVYNTIKALRIGTLPKEDRFSILRAAKALRTVATSFDDFLKDAQERLKPEGFDALADKARAFDTLTDQEKAEVNRRLGDYQKDVDDCVKGELEREVEIEALPAIAEETLSEIAAANTGLDVQTLMLMEDLFSHDATA